jgi:hypothetical protein
MGIRDALTRESDGADHGWREEFGTAVGRTWR